MGVLDGLEVLDLSWGISGPMTGMLLADHGARVTRIEPPGGDPFQRLSGYRVWHRGKRNAVLDLKDPVDSDRFRALAAKADVLIESFSPGVTKRLGIDYESLASANPRLIYCSITGYGPDGDRPGIDGLVAARTGHQWEIRGVEGGTIGRLSGTDGIMPGIEAPPGCQVGPDRAGPLFGGVPWVSVGTFYIASVAINAAIRARGITGHGQFINASLLHGVLATTIGPWQQAEKADAPNYQTWIIDPRAPKGFFRTSDDRWTHHWVPLPEFILNAAASGMRATPEVSSPKTASLRVSPMPEDMLVMHAYHEQMSKAVAAYPAADWVSLAATVGVPVQTVRSPEEALLDPLLVADGCVTEVDDPEIGPIRQVGRVVELSRHPYVRPAAAARRGEHTEAVRAEAESPRESAPPEAAATNLSAPLSGITVLDLGLAVAGPFGTQVLAQLGARVIKVNTRTDKYWFANHIAMCCNRDKESITLNLKTAEGMSVLHRLVEQADVVQHNMRYEAAQRLGVDYESLRDLNPKLIYCHTIGHEQGPRQHHPGNDQTAAALAGTEWLDGGLDNDGRPIWSVTSLGDMGNGYLSAVGIIQALYDRDRTGEGQFVRTSILYAHLLNSSMAWVSPDGSHVGDRQRLDGECYGWHALYRLYETAEGWLCVAALTDDDWERLCFAIDRTELPVDPRFADAAARAANDEALADILAQVFVRRPANEWFEALDKDDVPCEISDPDYVLRLFADPVAERRKLVASFRHPVVGDLKVAGLYFDLSGTPGVLQGGPVWPGQDSVAILTELGYSADEIAKLVVSGVVDHTASRTEEKA